MSEEARHELNQRALDPAASSVVSACAGSGKTWLLVSRIVRLLLAGAAPSEILAITFTRKAAQEMASRLRDWLRELALAEDDDTIRRFLREREMTAAEIETALPRARLVYEQFLTAQPAITITTFHSWFLQLLRRAPLDAGALGAVDLVEQPSSLVDDAWQRFAGGAQREPDEPVAQGLQFLFREIGLESTRLLLGGFLQRRAEWWAYTRGKEDPVGFALGEIVETMAPLLPEADVVGTLLSDAGFTADGREYAALLSRNTPTDRKFALRLDETRTDATLYFEALCEVVLTKTDDNLRSRKTSPTQAKRLGAEGEARLLALHAALGERVGTARAQLAAQASYRLNEAAMRCGVALLDTYQAVKRERQVIDYADIEWHAYDLVTAGEHAVYMHYKLDARYRHILLDEFQDTNPLQWFTLRSWFAAASEAGTAPVVFMVGDPKQSIYRFRRAEARLFGQAADYLARGFGAALLSQDESRRCAPPLIETVNRLFEAETQFEGFLRHGAHYAGKPGWVEVLPLVRAQTAAPVEREVTALRDPLSTPLALEEDRRREREAQGFVARLREIVETCQVVDDMQGPVLRPARYDDVMVLVRRRTHLEVYERALRHAGIPFVTSRQGGLLATLEAQDLIALLEFLVAPFSDLQLAHALRTPVFGCGDGDLVAIVRAGTGTWWERLCAIARDAEASPSPELVRAHGLLSQWLGRTDTAPVHDQLDRIYFEGAVLARYEQAVPEAMRAGVVANLQAFMQRALDTDSGRYPSLPRFIRELADLRDAPSDEAPDEGIVGDTGRALRIYTVHGAKGLEAPIVWLLDAAAGQDARGAYEVLCDWPPDCERPRHFSLRGRKETWSAQQRELTEQEAALDAREDLNLLYVAMTRAKQALIVSGVDGKGSADSWFEKIRAAVIAATGMAQPPADAQVRFGALPGSRDISPKQEDAGPRAAQPDNPRLTAPLPTGTRMPAETSRGMRYGTYFHLIMEQLTGPMPADREGIRRLLGLSPDDFDPLWEDAQRLLATPALERFFAADKCLRAANEVSFTNAAGAVRRIDRVVEMEDEVWVLDYKTGEVAGDTGLLGKYEAQIAEYRAAIAGLHPDKPVRALLIFADGAVHEFR